jgi:hypothetical protein
LIMLFISMFLVKTNIDIWLEDLEKQKSE